ncbi:MAG: diphthine synthase [Candidatus Woesearchaeota archaeon]
MVLYLIGIGLGKDDISLKGLDAARNSNKIWLDAYTSPLLFELSALEKLIGKKIQLASRELVEQKPEESLFKGAKDANNALLVVGDPFAATTHIDLVLRALKQGIEVKVIHSASVFTAVAETGLQLYKFGKTASIPFPEKGYLPETPYEILKQNQSISAHTLFLLDLKPDENRFVTIADAIALLQKIELLRNEKVFTADTLCIGCSRLGSEDQKIKVGKAKELLKQDFGKPPHCLIVPSKLHFVEEEALKRFLV